MAFICVNWSMTCRLTEEHAETVVGLVTSGGCNLVFVDRIMIFIPFVSVEDLEMSCADAAEALAPLVCCF